MIVSTITCLWCGRPLMDVSGQHVHAETGSYACGDGNMAGHTAKAGE